MDREHVHMNSTRWLTLSDFTEWLGTEGHAEVDYQEGKGWFLAYIDKDPQTMARKKELEKLMRKKDRDESEEAMKIQQMIEEGKIKESISFFEGILLSESILSIQISAIGHWGQSSLNFFAQAYFFLL
jgi:DNA/RNA-binding protein KIN17